LILAAGVTLSALLFHPACRRESDGGGNAQKLRLAVIPMGTTHEFWKAIHAGAKKAADETGVEIIWKGPLKEDDRNEQVQIVETMIDAGVDALILTPLDDRALMAPVAEAKARGIPTVIFNTALKGGDFIAYVSTDNWKGGVLAAERIGELMQGRGKLILIRIIEGVEGNRQREEGFLETIRTRFPAIEILSDNQYAGITTETAYQTTENLLARFHDVEAIFTPNESTTFGCLRALQDPVRMGYDSVRAAVAHLRREPHESRIDTGVFLATPENMHQPDIRRLLIPDLTILER